MTSTIPEIEEQRARFRRRAEETERRLKELEAEFLRRRNANPLAEWPGGHTISARVLRYTIGATAVLSALAFAAGFAAARM